ncbi:HEAT repeat domain-containing protein [Bacteriovoracaceae bacterium]|nr:HEAT repeat domain-containing protein [Bacteriovoracaceae bacterium]
MKKIVLLPFLSCLIIASNVLAANAKWKPKYQEMKLTDALASKNSSGPEISNLEKAFSLKSKDKAHIKKLKNTVLTQGNKSVPTLIKVMKSDNFPEHKRWTATFLLGRIMGDKAAPFIAKFAQHPNWMMRLASIKTLTAMKNKKYLKVYAAALKDKALIVRSQGLDTIKALGINKLAPSVWSMMYDKRNYKPQAGKNKRDDIIRKIIKTVGDLNFKAAQKPLLKMASSKKFTDVFNELDYSLRILSGKKSPKGGVGKKRYFWKRVALSKTLI